MLYKIFVVLTLIFLIVGLVYYTGLMIKEYIIDYILYGEDDYVQQDMDTSGYE